MDIKIRLLNISELFGLARTCYKARFKYIMFLCAIALVPLSIVECMVPTPINELLNPTAYPINEFAMALGRYALIISVLNALFMPIYYSGMTYIATHNPDASSPEQPIPIRSILDVTINKWAKLALTGFICLAISLISTPLVVLAIFVYVLLFYATFFGALGDIWGIKAIRASYNLVRGRWFKTFGFIILINICMLAVSAVVQRLFGVFISIVYVNDFVGEVIGFILVLLIKVLCSYFDLVMSFKFLNVYYTKGAHNVN